MHNNGAKAEIRVKKHLEQVGFKLIDQNWRRRSAEIDLIMSQSGHIKFIEVKYRKYDFQGSGFEYITKTKLKQMTFAANLWISENSRLNMLSRELLVAEVSGDYSRIDVRSVI